MGDLDTYVRIGRVLSCGPDPHRVELETLSAATLRKMHRSHFVSDDSRADPGDRFDLEDLENTNYKAGASQSAKRLLSPQKGSDLDSLMDPVDRAAAGLVSRAQIKVSAAAQGLNHPFFRLSPQARLVMVSLHIGRWSYERIARILGYAQGTAEEFQKAIDEVQKIAWDARTQLALDSVTLNKSVGIVENQKDSNHSAFDTSHSSHSSASNLSRQPSMSTRARPWGEFSNGRSTLARSAIEYPAAPVLSENCPPYRLSAPWTQQFLDQQLGSPKEKVLIQNHLTGCSSCAQALARCRVLYYRADELVREVLDGLEQSGAGPLYDHQAKLCQEALVMTQTPSKMRSDWRTQGASLTEVFVKLMESRDVILVLSGLLILFGLWSLFQLF